MSLEHIYSAVTEKRRLESGTYVILLQDHTMISLPPSAYETYTRIEPEDRLLIDFKCDDIPEAVQIFVFRKHNLVTNFGVNRDYIDIVAPA